MSLQWGIDLGGNWIAFSAWGRSLIVAEACYAISPGKSFSYRLSSNKPHLIADPMIFQHIKDAQAFAEARELQVLAGEHKQGERYEAQTIPSP